MGVHFAMRLNVVIKKFSSIKTIGRLVPCIVLVALTSCSGSSASQDSVLVVAPSTVAPTTTSTPSTTSPTSEMTFIRFDLQKFISNRESATQMTACLNKLTTSASGAWASMLNPGEKYSGMFLTWNTDSDDPGADQIWDRGKIAAFDIFVEIGDTGRIEMAASAVRGNEPIPQVGGVYESSNTLSNLLIWTSRENLSRENPPSSMKVSSEFMNELLRELATCGLPFLTPE